ncbi:MAG: T9SS type A sorting domain-containing protein [Bacteroidia bacterium]|nr:T9SS type A sorting domain-containing protein [Bacteroidia bacterium]
MGFQILNDTSYYNLRTDGLYISKDQGDNWNKLHIVNVSGDTLSKSSFSTFYVYPNGFGFINCLPNYNTSIYVTKDFCKTWSKVDSNKTSIRLADNNGVINFPKVFAFNSTAYSIKLLTPNSLICYKNYGDSAYDIDLSTMIGGGSVRDIAFKDELNAMLLTSTNDIYTSNDGCKTFTKKSSPPVNSSNLEFAKPSPNKQSFYIVSGRGGSSGLYYTRDDGNKWNQIEDFYHYYTIDFYNSEIGVASVTESDRLLYFSGITGIKEEYNSLFKFSIYPNPCFDYLYIQGEFKNTEYKIFNMVGQIISNGFLDGRQATINLSSFNLTNGIYMISIKDLNGAWINKLFYKG